MALVLPTASMVRRDQNWLQAVAVHMFCRGPQLVKGPLSLYLGGVGQNWRIGQNCGSNGTSARSSAQRFGRFYCLAATGASCSVMTFWRCVQRILNAAVTKVPKSGFAGIIPKLTIWVLLRQSKGHILIMGTGHLIRSMLGNC